MVAATKSSKKSAKDAKRPTKATNAATPKSAKSKAEKTPIPPSPSSKSQSIPQLSSSSKFVSNALNKPRPDTKKAATAVNKAKIPKPSEVKQRSKLAPPADSDESSDEGEDVDEKIDVEEDKSSDKGDDDGSSEEEEDTHLHGFSSSDDDSSDEDDDMGVEPVGIDVGKLPTIAKDDESVKRKLDKAKKQPVSQVPCATFPYLTNHFSTTRYVSG